MTTGSIFVPGGGVKGPVSLPWAGWPGFAGFCPAGCGCCAGCPAGWPACLAASFICCQRLGFFGAVWALVVPGIVAINVASMASEGRILTVERIFKSPQRGGINQLAAESDRENNPRFYTNGNPRGSLSGDGLRCKK